ncbi:MAG TPA: CDP-archaeol synthase, partial [Candidatus Competibacteraceae bacterium]|nr:CDP-archaeol synthase [Candidatus Competibacteraceae bacterium]
WAWLLDGGRVLADGQRLFGTTKTWRGLLAAVLMTGSGALLLGVPAAVGALIGLLAMAGDLLSSFIKRRLGRPSSSMMLGLDQVPEALLPLLAVREAFALDAPAIVVTVIAFLLLDLLLSQVLYRLGIRQRPY